MWLYCPWWGSDTLVVVPLIKPSGVTLITMIKQQDMHTFSFNHLLLICEYAVQSIWNTIHVYIIIAEDISEQLQPISRMLTHQQLWIHW